MLAVRARGAGSAAAWATALAPGYGLARGRVPIELLVHACVEMSSWIAKRMVDPVR